MRETEFTRKIHRLLPDHVYAWNISDRFTRGIPDAYYSGPAADLWVEYKFYPVLPSKTFQLGAKLTPAQRHWLQNRHAEKRNVAVVIADKSKAIFLENLAWTDTIQPAYVTHKQLAQLIADKTCND